MAFFVPAPPRQPFLQAPTSVIWLIVVLVAIHVAVTMSLVPSGVLDVLYLVPARFVTGEAGLGVVSLFGHIFLHSGTGHLLLNCLWLLIFGSAMARRYGPLWFFGFFLASGVVAGLTYLAFNWGAGVGAVGASGAIAGLLAAGLRLIPWPNIAAENRLAPLTSTPILAASVLWIGTNVFYASADAGGVVWQAHCGGYLFGLFAISLVDQIATLRAGRQA